MQQSTQMYQTKCWLFILIVLATLTAGAQKGDSTKLTIADIKIIHSKILNEDRKIYISIPTTISGQQTSPAPVLYLMDGDAHTALVTSQIQYLSESYGELPQMIVVGIANYSYDRIRDLSPTHSLAGADSATSPFKTSGGGEKFIQFVKEEVMPFVEQNYNTLPYKILSGHSLGGLMSIYCLSAHPELFNAYIAVSPSLWWDNGIELKRATRNLNQTTVKNKVLFYSDGSEGGDFHEKVLALEPILKEMGAIGFRYKYLYYPDESHGAEPVKAEYDALKFIYSKWKPSTTDTTFEQVKQFYEHLSSEYGYAVVPPEMVVNTIAYDFMNKPSRLNDAIELLMMNVANYPTSFNTYDSLGDAYVQKGDKVKAISNYKKALELNPKSLDTRKKLQDLEK